MLVRNHRAPSLRRKHAACDSALLENMIDILQRQALRLREETIDYGNPQCIQDCEDNENLPTDVC